MAQNKKGRLGLGDKKMVGIETIRDEVGWSTFEEMILKNVLNYNVKLENLEDSRWPRKFYIMIFSNSLLLNSNSTSISGEHLQSIDFNSTSISGEHLQSIDFNSTSISGEHSQSIDFNSTSISGEH